MKIGAIFESDDWYRIPFLTTDWIFEHGDAWFWHVFIIDLGNKGKRGEKRFGVLGAKIRQILSSKIFNLFMRFYWIHEMVFILPVLS